MPIHKVVKMDRNLLRRFKGTCQVNHSVFVSSQPPGVRMAAYGASTTVRCAQMQQFYQAPERSFTVIIQSLDSIRPVSFFHYLSALKHRYKSSIKKYLNLGGTFNHAMHLFP